MKFISNRSINKRVNLCRYIGLTWCTCVLPLQPYHDITTVLFCRLNNVDILLLFLTKFIRYKNEMPDATADTLLKWYKSTCTLQPYRDITPVLFCRLINVDIFFTVLTIFIRYKTELQDNRHIVDAIYMHLFKLIYRSYRYIYFIVILLLHSYQASCGRVVMTVDL